jgi:hypothetical protein
MLVIKKMAFRSLFIDILIFTANIQSSPAQDINAENTPGKIAFQETPDPSWQKLFNVQSSVGRSNYYKPMEKYVAEVCNIVTDVPTVKPPRGFTIKPYISGSSKEFDRLFPDRVLPYMNVTFCDYPFFTDKQTHQIKPSGEWGTSIRVFVNDPEWLLETDYNVLNHCDSLGIPYFYYRPGTYTDKNGYWVMKPSKGLTEIRIIKKKNVPLYIPLTQKEYLEYKLKLHQRSLASDKKMLAVSEKKLQNLQYPENDPVFKQDIKDENQNIEDDIKAIRDYQQALSAWSAEKLNAPAYTSIYYRPKRGQNQIDLVSADYKGARELVRFNRAYFDKTLPKGIPQLIMIGAQDDPHFSVPYVTQKVNNWFNQIDYGKLQAMIK